MSLSFKEVRKKLLAGDISGLFHASKHRQRNVIHPSEVARLFISIPNKKAVDAFKLFKPEQQVEVFPYLDILLQKKIIKALTHEQAAYILNSLSSDDRSLFYSMLSGVELSDFLSYLNEENKTLLHKILGYGENSIAKFINTDFTTVQSNMTIAEAMEYLREHQKDSNAANNIYVVDETGKLVDDIPIRRFVLNDPNKKVTDILDGYCTSLKIFDKEEDAIHKFKEYDRSVLPVTNHEDVLLGVVTIDDMVDVMEQKDTAEIQKFGGIEELDYPYVKTPFASLIRKRAGWLIILFLGEMLTATAMGYFDTEISKAVVLALFVPLVISSGGNSGSQAATLIIRAMALKELTLKDWWYVMRREILSGLSLGIVLGAIGFVRITLWQQLHLYNYGQYWFVIAITIFFSLIGIVMWGTLSGSMIPMILKKLRIDPATSSAPFVATLVDVTGLIIYFSVAAIFLKGKLL